MVDTVASAVAKSITEVHFERFEQIAKSLLVPGERGICFHLAEDRTPSLLRLIPHIPEFLLRDSKYLLVITDRRLLVVRLTNPDSLLALPAFKRLVASIPLAEVKEFYSHNGHIHIRTNSGRGYGLTDALDPDGRRLNEAFALARIAARVVPANAAPVPSFAHRVWGLLGIVRVFARVNLGLAGLLFGLGGVVGMSLGDFGPASMMLVFSALMLFISLRVLRRRN